MKRLFNFRALPFMLAAVVAGVCLSVFAPPYIVWPIAAAALALGICSLFIKSMARAKAICACFALALIAACISGSVALWRTDTSDLPQECVPISGRICMPTDFDAEGNALSSGGYEGYGEIYLVQLNMDGEEYGGKACVMLTDDVIKKLKIGDTLSFFGYIAGKKLIVTDNYSVREYKNGIRYDLTPIFGVAPLEIEHGKPAASERVRLASYAVLAKSTSTQCAEFVYAMMFGDSSGLSREVKSAFSVTGTAHVFAVSGLHVGIIAGALAMLLKAFKAKRWVYPVVTVPLLALYSWLCGFSPSTVRASLMCAVYLTARAVGARNDILSTVSLSAIVILLVKPIYLFDLGFLMSFWAVFGIIFLCKPLERAMSGVLPHVLSSALAVSIAANAGLLPIMLAYFGKISFIFVLANLLILPVLSFIFPLLMVSVLSGCVLPFMSAAVAVLCVPVRGIMWVADKLAAVKFLVLDFTCPWYFMLPHAAILFALSDYCFVHGKAKKLTACALCGLCVAGGVTSLKGVTLADVSVRCFRDAYDNDFAIITGREGTFLIVDDALSKDGMTAASAVMEKLGVSRLDGLVRRTLGQGEILLLQRGYAALSPSALYIADYSGQYDIGIPIASSALGDGFSISQYEGKSFVTVGSVTLCLSDTEVTEDYTLLFGEDGKNAASGGRYIVDDLRYERNEKYYLPTDFTIGFKNGKIMKTPFWVYS